ncbi:hypothetical protein F53441_13956 [Fusarium austroafricanum]|uniref:Uncharacterized protein n=1 Tax=Fusarium austroafricanum TaxID=2364996 RepID=A0A8H4JJK9_9HYPO|nr:hypothetical protein F53441_13956 [Fusarium austroafricanum]
MAPPKLPPLAQRPAKRPSPTKGGSGRHKSIKVERDDGPANFIKEETEETATDMSQFEDNGPDIYESDRLRLETRFRRLNDTFVTYEQMTSDQWLKKNQDWLFMLPDLVDAEAEIHRQERLRVDEEARNAEHRALLRLIPERVTRETAPLVPHKYWVSLYMWCTEHYPEHCDIINVAFQTRVDIENRIRIPPQSVEESLRKLEDLLTLLPNDMLQLAFEMKEEVNNLFSHHAMQRVETMRYLSRHPQRLMAHEEAMQEGDQEWIQRQRGLDPLL